MTKQTTIVVIGALRVNAENQAKEQLVPFSVATALATYRSLSGINNDSQATSYTRAMMHPAHCQWIVMDLDLLFMLG